LAKHKRQPGIPIRYHPEALADMQAMLDRATLADVIAIVDRLNLKTHQEIVAMLDSRTEQKVCQWESSNPAGALRVVFAWGKACLWCIGAFVKGNDAEGERYMRRILPRAIAVRDLGAQ